MSLITCACCGKPVSENTNACPHCGEPVKKPILRVCPSCEADWLPDATQCVFCGYTLRLKENGALPSDETQILHCSICGTAYESSYECCPVCRSPKQYAVSLQQSADDRQITPPPAKEPDITPQPLSEPRRVSWPRWIVGILCLLVSGYCLLAALDVNVLELFDNKTDIAGRYEFALKAGYSGAEWNERILRIPGQKSIVVEIVGNRDDGEGLAIYDDPLYNENGRRCPWTCIPEGKVGNKEEGIMVGLGANGVVFSEDMTTVYSSLEDFANKRNGYPVIKHSNDR